jgi:hypothetical protein
MKRNKLLLILAFFFALNAFNGCNRQEVIVVRKTPRGIYAGEESLYNFGWYDIGLSRNGKEPVEYIWCAEYDGYGYFIMNAKIGDKGTIGLNEWAKEHGEKLPRPNAKAPPIIGSLGEVYWEKKDKNQQ